MKLSGKLLTNVPLLILVAAFLLMMFGSPVGLLVVLVIVKTLLDAKLHLREHRKLQSSIS
jgi:hypothetical protein